MPSAAPPATLRNSGCDGAVLDVDQRTLHRVGDELLAERGFLGAHPVVQHDDAGA